MGEGKAPGYRRLLGWFLLLEILLLGYLIFELWPAVAPAAQTVDGAADAAREKISIFGSGLNWEPSREVALLTVVLLLGALGAALYSLRSFALHHGNKTFEDQWLWWYVLRTPIGTAVALVIYFTVRGGLLSVDVTTEELNVYGFGAVAALAGLFSAQALEKLKEAFMALVGLAREATVSGEVIDSDGEPVSAARVTLSNGWIFDTQDDGRFEFRGLSGGRYSLTAQKQGYETAPMDLVVEARTPTTVTVRLEPEKPEPTT